MDYTKFQVEDFVTDPYFIKWVKDPAEEHMAFWNAWLSKNPHCKARVEEARHIILLLDVEEDALPEGKFIELWESISREDGVKNISPLTLAADAPPVRTLKTRWYYQAAATLLLLAVGGAAYYAYSSRTVTVTTAYGESRALFLPDSTKVTLNSNSSIRYATADFSNNKREVSLTGEAFFAVSHKADHQNFIVHTDELQVEVLGTKFDVNSRRGTTRVVLQEGKVKLDLQSAQKTSLVMKPGELVEFTESSEATLTKAVDAGNYSAWKNNKLIFSRTSLLEIAHLLEDNYGYKVVFENDEISKRNFTGTSSSENLQELFGKLAEVFDLNIKREANTLIIQYKKENPKQHSPS